VEIRNAAEAYEILLNSALTTERATWIWWAPGDFTRYRVTLVNAIPWVDVPGTRAMLVVEVANDAIVLPYEPLRLWTIESFHARFGEKYAGWWAGVRPLLAAFGWTSTRADDVAYSTDDAVEMGRLLAEAK
jgi:hypothetical protein